ncbi:hypothetical protein GCM10008968_26500 [Bacillus horti]
MPKQAYLSFTYNKMFPLCKTYLELIIQRIKLIVKQKMLHASFIIATFKQSIHIKTSQYLYMS